MPMIATTIKSSINEKPSWRLLVMLDSYSLRFKLLAPSAFVSKWSRAEREVSGASKTTVVPSGIGVKKRKFRSFLIEILILES